MLDQIAKKLTSYDSLALLPEYFETVDLGRTFNDQDHHDQACDLDMVKSIIGLFALGKCDFNEINAFQSNRYFRDALTIFHLPKGQDIHEWVSQRNDALLENVMLLLTRLAPEAQPESQNLADLLAQFTRLCLDDMAKTQRAFELINLEKSLFTPATRDHLDAQGFCVIEGVMSPEEVAELRHIVLRLAEWEREQGSAHLYGNDNKLQRVWNLLNKHEIFRDLIQRPVIHQVMNHIFDRPTLHAKYVLHSWQANIVNKGGEAQMMHVDSAVPEPLPQWPIRANANLLLNDFTEDNGASLIVPATHHNPNKPTPDAEHEPSLIKAIAPAGAMVVWHGSLWHQSGQNNCDEPRIALLGGFCSSHLKEMAVEEDYIKVMDPDLQKNASPLLKRLIGFDHGVQKGALQRPPEW